MAQSALDGEGVTEENKTAILLRFPYGKRNLDTSKDLVGLRMQSDLRKMLGDRLFNTIYISPWALYSDVFQMAHSWTSDD